MVITIITKNMSDLAGEHSTVSNLLFHYHDNQQCTWVIEQGKANKWGQGDLSELMYLSDRPFSKVSVLIDSPLWFRLLFSLPRWRSYRYARALFAAKFKAVSGAHLDQTVTLIQPMTRVRHQIYYWGAVMAMTSWHRVINFIRRFSFKQIGVFAKESVVQQCMSATAPLSPWVWVQIDDHWLSIDLMHDRDSQMHQLFFGDSRLAQAEQVLSKCTLSEQTKAGPVIFTDYQDKHRHDVIDHQFEVVSVKAPAWAKRIDHLSYEKAQLLWLQNGMAQC